MYGNAPPPVNTVVALVKERAIPWRSFSTGVISLEHDLYDLTASFGPPVIEAVLEAGMNAVSVAECVSDTFPYIKENDPIATITLNLSSSANLPQSTRSSKATDAASNTFEVNGDETVISRGLWFWTLFIFQHLFGFGS